jgi:hypothetical protein
MIDRKFLILAALFTLQPWTAAGEVATPAGGDGVASGTWTGVPRVIAVGDLHGSYEKAIRMFQGAGLVDADLHWNGGRQHLVVAGDMLDRGSGDRPLMALIRRLQGESRSAGGRVHVLLGNHEAMNLMRDLRYVNPESYQHWAADETKAARKAAWRVFKSTGADGRSEDELSSEFEESFPPGYFARQSSLEPQGEYGEWLLGLPAIVKINDVVYVHGGLTVETAVLGIDELNRRLGDDLRRHLAARQVLEDKGIISPLMTFGEIRWVAREGVEKADRLPPVLADAARDLDETFNSLLLGDMGPLWYRGNASEDERIEREMLERSLELLGAKAMVVAHSPTPNKQITSRFHGQLFRVDHDINTSDTLQALVIESEEIVVLDASTHQTSEPMRELPTGELEAQEAEMSDGERQEFLLRAAVIDSRFLGRGSTRPRLLELELEGHTERGIFKTVADGEAPSPAEAHDRFEHEVAAYRMDRLLGLNMVPVTVVREIDGQLGSLQSWVEGAVDQEASRAYDLELFAMDKCGSRLASSEVFDALIGNRDREPDDILCLVSGDRTFLIDHSEAFATATDLGWVEERSLTIEVDLLHALRALDRQSLESSLGDLLSASQIEAILERRDKVLDRVRLASQDAPASESTKP